MNILFCELIYLWRCWDQAQSMLEVKKGVFLFFFSNGNEVTLNRPNLWFRNRDPVSDNLILPTVLLQQKHVFLLYGKKYTSTYSLFVWYSPVFSCLLFPWMQNCESQALLPCWLWQTVRTWQWDDSHSSSVSVIPAACGLPVSLSPGDTKQNSFLKEKKKYTNQLYIHHFPGLAAPQSGLCVLYNGLSNGVHKKLTKLKLI